jgi:tRNA (guanine37-N1)-methyltransferase
VDDYPYGGGAGMVLKPDVVDAALHQVRTEESWVILMSPQGRTLDQSRVSELAMKNHLVVICGHYEGLDARNTARSMRKSPLVTIFLPEENCRPWCWWML